jgi:hypothetical protein
MLSQPRLTQHQLRVRSDILEFGLEIDYLPGTRNYIQNTLSYRSHYKEPPTFPQPKLTHEGSILTIEYDTQDKWFERIKSEYQKDNYYGDMLDVLTKGLNKNIPIQDQCRFLARAKF